MADGTWRRLLAADCRGMFHETASAAAIEALARQHRNMLLRRWRRGRRLDVAGAGA
jgi:hypothetical protein